MLVSHEMDTPLILLRVKLALETCYGLCAQITDTKNRLQVHTQLLKDDKPRDNAILNAIRCMEDMHFKAVQQTAEMGIKLKELRSIFPKEELSTIPVVIKDNEMRDDRNMMDAVATETAIVDYPSSLHHSSSCLDPNFDIQVTDQIASRAPEEPVVHSHDHSLNVDSPEPWALTSLRGPPGSQKMVCHVDEMSGIIGTTSVPPNDDPYFGYAHSDVGNRSDRSDPEDMLQDKELEGINTSAPRGAANVRKRCAICHSAFECLEAHAMATGHKAFACFYTSCSSTYKRRTLLLRHELIHKDSKRYPCTICEKYRGSKAFIRKDHLQQHIYNAHKDKVDTFPKCCQHVDCRLLAGTSEKQQLFASRKEYRNHLRDVHDETAFPCQWHGCDRKGKRGFARERDLQLHMRIHDQEIPGSLGQVWTGPGTEKSSEEGWSAMASGVEYPTEAEQGDHDAAALFGSGILACT
jgi:hypothetical protein